LTFWRFTNRIIIIIIIIITTLLREHGKSQGGHYSKSGGILQHLHRKTDIITVSTVLNTHTHTSDNTSVEDGGEYFGAHSTAPDPTGKVTALQNAQLSTLHILKRD